MRFPRPETDDERIERERLEDLAFQERKERMIQKGRPDPCERARKPYRDSDDEGSDEESRAVL